ncbi:MAG: hypothetical protein M3P97_12360 [Actinomycetota bacterium]|nr:hypothetical protein [Actinomycetota bacterium]
MDPYVGAGYGVTLLTLALYSARVVRRSRALARSVSGGPGAPARSAGEGRRG